MGQPNTTELEINTDLTKISDEVKTPDVENITDKVTEETITTEQ